MKKLIIIMTVMCAYACCYAQEIGEGEYYQATVKTSQGNIVIKLYNDTPVHRDNFVKLAREDFYSAILFHRVIEDFMIQCGDPDTQLALSTRQYGSNDSGYKLPAEIVADHHHFVGAVAAAREGDETNPERKSSGSQFYIVVGQKEMTEETLQKADKSRIGNGLGQIPEDIKEEYHKRGGSPHLDGTFTVFGEVVKGIEIAEKISKERTDRYDRPVNDIYIKAIDIKVVRD